VGYLNLGVGGGVGGLGGVVGGGGGGGGGEMNHRSQYNCHQYFYSLSQSIRTVVGEFLTTVNAATLIRSWY